MQIDQTQPEKSDRQHTTRDAPANTFWGRLVERWHRCKEALRTAKPCRLSLIIGVMVPLVFMKNDQAAEVLRCLAETESGIGRFQFVAFIASLVVLCLYGWYFARLLLYFRFADSPPNTPTTRWVRRHLPRFIGLVPAIGFGVTCWVIAAAYSGPLSSGPRAVLIGYGIVCWVMAVLMVGFYKARERFLNRTGHATPAAATVDSPSLLPKGSKAALAGFSLISISLFAAFLGAPVFSSQLLGSGAVVLLAAASWVCYGSLGVYLAHRWQFPVIALLVGAAVIFTLWNDNHLIRTLNKPALMPTQTTAYRYDDWYTNLAKAYPAESPRPVFLIAAEGGGIRAAFWTATVLGELQDANPNFAAHVFAISGVSGGSLGAVVFDALLADGVRTNMTSQAQTMLAHDFLSPALSYMLFPDMLQRFLPVSLPVFDRARALEMAWEDGWRKTRGNNLFATSFDALWSKEPNLPNLFLNGTLVENGKRIITSNLQMDADITDAIDAHEKLHGAIRISTAAHMSARFTYVSPAGRFTNGDHVVDGGYFENSGGATADDIYWIVDKEKLNGAKLFVILISNNPTETSSKKSPEQQHEFLSEALAPVQTLLHTREARGSYSETMLGGKGAKFYRFSLEARATPLPLGWQLSKGAVEEMRAQMHEQRNKVEEIARLLPR